MGHFQVAAQTKPNENTDRNYKHLQQPLIAQIFEVSQHKYKKKICSLVITFYYQSALMIICDEVWFTLFRKRREMVHNTEWGMLDFVDICLMTHLYLVYFIQKTKCRRVAGRRALAWWHDTRVHIPCRRASSLEDSVE